MPDTLARLAAEEHRPRAEEFRAHFRRRSDEIMVAWTEVFPAAGATAALLWEMGFRLGIVSTKFRCRIQDTLQREGLLDQFGIIVGGEDVAPFKPDPQGLLMAAERAGSRPEQVLYVGDSLTDAETARRAQARFLAVLSGMTAREEFDGYQPEGFLAHPISSDYPYLPSGCFTDGDLPVWPSTRDIRNWGQPERLKCATLSGEPGNLITHAFSQSTRKPYSFSSTSATWPATLTLG